MLMKNEMVPIRVTERYTFYRNGRTSGEEVE
jgi:hypothetical protein